MAEALQALGEWLQALGLRIMPDSFAIYFPVRWAEHALRRGHTRLIKAAWYAVLGLMYLFGAVGAGTVAMYICFIEAWDLVFDHLERRREVPQAEDA